MVPNRTFCFHCVEELPPLSWCSVIDKGSSSADVYHGKFVETSHGFFVEGGWDKPFQEGQFENSTLFMGSGGKIMDSKFIFCTPCHTMERLYVFSDCSRLLLSNSMPFILKMSDQHLDMSYISHNADIISIILGTSRYVKSVPTEPKGRLHFYCYCNIEIDYDLNIRVIRKTPPEPYVDYRSYKHFLIDGLTALIDNLNSDSRLIKYSLATTVSSGYDSAACAALAKEIGCTKAITLAKDDGADSGAEIARALGYADITERLQNEYMDMPGYPEAEFVATGVLGEDMVMACFEDILPQTILLTGFHGDQIWGMSQGDPSVHIVRGDPSGCDLTEFRLRTGWINAPIPLWGAVNHPSVQAISNSNEMQEWVLSDTAYNRPIPRRLVEERNVPRKLFGQAKQYIAISLWLSSITMKKKMTAESFSDFMRYYNKMKQRRHFFPMLFYRMMYWFYIASLTVNMKIFRRFKIPFQLPYPSSLRWFRYKYNPDHPSFLIHWGLSRISPRYDIAVKLYNEKQQ